LDTNLSSIKTLRGYFDAGLIEGGLAFIYLFLIPTDPKNAWLLGYSKTRWVLVAVMVILTAGLGWLTYKARNESWLEKLLEHVQPYITHLRWYVPGILFSYGLVIATTFLYLFFIHGNLTTLNVRLVRLSPFLVLFFSRLLQSIRVSITLLRQEERNPLQGDAVKEIVIRPKMVVTALGGIALLLVLTSSLLDVIEGLTWRQQFLGYRAKFDLGQEANVPTMFSTTLLLISALASWVIAKTRRSQKFFYHWAGLASVFIILAVDETSVLHEKLIKPLREGLGTSGFFHYAWIIVAIPVVIIFFVTYTRFFLSLPPNIKRGFAIGFGLYLVGTIGFEGIGGILDEGIYHDSVLSNMATTLEETIEIIGVLALIKVLLNYLAEPIGQVKIIFGGRTKMS
jgi:hypothetical protein